MIVDIDENGKFFITRVWSNRLKKMLFYLALIVSKPLFPLFDFNRRMELTGLKTG